jgi:hypothetical protein
MRFFRYVVISFLFVPISFAYAQDEVDFASTINTLYIWGIRVVAIMALLGLIVGGYQYMTSGGNANAAGNAKSTIIAALSGLLLALGSFVFLNIFSPQFTSNLGPDFKALNVPQIPAGTRCGSVADCSNGFECRNGFCASIGCTGEGVVCDRNNPSCCEPFTCRVFNSQTNEYRCQPSAPPPPGPDCQAVNVACAIDPDTQFHNCCAGLFCNDFAAGTFGDGNGICQPSPT